MGDTDAKNITVESSSTIKAIFTELSGVKDDLERLVLLVDGDERRDVIGIRKRVDTLETLTKLIQTKQEDAEQQRAVDVAWRKGILAGLGVTGVSSLGTLIAFIVKFVVGGAP